jgi:hypothetical protein
MVAMLILIRNEFKNSFLSKSGGQALLSTQRTAKSAFEPELNPFLKFEFEHHAPPLISGEIRTTEPFEQGGFFCCFFLFITLEPRLE